MLREVLRKRAVQTHGPIPSDLFFGGQPTGAAWLQTLPPVVGKLHPDAWTEVQRSR